MGASEFKEKVRDATNIVDVVSQHTELKRAGGHLKGICPLPGHNEKTPSFTVNDSNQLFYCFGCQRGGDVFKFAELVMGLGFRESLEYFADKAGIEIPQFQSKDSGKLDHLKEKLEINRLAKEFFKRSLQSSNEDSEIWKYIEGRSLSKEVIEQFEIGYAPDSWDALTNELTNKKANLSAANEIGIIRERKQGNGHYDTQRGRLIFPIISTRDEVVGFGGRILTDDKKEAKYINSSESDIFHKGKVLYGLKTAAPFIRQEDAVILVEGYMDVVALYQKGFKNAVGVLGTAFTDGHARLVKRYTNNVFVLFDKDQAGWTATQRALPVLLKFGLSPKLIDLGEHKDPDDFLAQEGAEKFKTSLKKAPDLFTYWLDRNLKGTNLTPTTKVRVLDVVKKVLAEAQDERLLKLYCGEVAARLNLPPAMVWQEIIGKQQGRSQADRLKTIQNASDRRGPQSNQKKVGPQNAVGNAPKVEKTLVALAICYKDLRELAQKDEVAKWVSSVELADMLKNSQDLRGHSADGSGSLAALLSEKIEELGLFEAVMAVKTEEIAAQRRQLFDDCARRIKERFLKEEASSMLNQVGAQVDRESLEAYMSLQKDRNSLRSGSEPEVERLVDEEN